MALFVRLVQIRCHRCGRLLCEVSAGSTIKVKCRHCQVWIVRDIA